jgi:hypothetical protein
MASQQTDKSRYPSKYSPGTFITAAQYIIELLYTQYCYKQQREPLLNFWQSDEGKKFLGGQLRVTYSLLKKYSPKALITTIEEKKIDNLRVKWILPWIARKQKTLDIISTKENISSEIVNNIPTGPITFGTNTKNKRNILDKLRDIDNE